MFFVSYFMHLSKSRWGISHSLSVGSPKVWCSLLVWQTMDKV